jgi:hypothetical protein
MVELDKKTEGRVSYAFALMSVPIEEHLIVELYSK